MNFKHRLNLPKKVAQTEEDRPLAEIKPIANKWSKQEHDRVIKGQEEEEKTVSKHLNLDKKHPTNFAQKLFSMFHPSLIPGATGRYLTLIQYLSHLDRKDYSQFYAQLEAQGISKADFEDACRILNSLSHERFLKSLFDTTRLNNYKRTGHIVNYYYLYTADKDLVENWVNNNLN